MSACSISGCECTSPIRLGLCLKHYTRLRRYGDPLRERPTLAERFAGMFRICPDTGCWLWTAALTNKGYGAIQLGVKKRGYAHRVSWELANGPIQHGLFVLHKCDTPACVNPAHLFLGTTTENMADMVAKGRSLGGTRNPNCKLTECQVAEAFSSSLSASALADQFGVAAETIRRIRRRENWRRMTFQTAPEPVQQFEDVPA